MAVTSTKLDLEVKVPPKRNLSPWRSRQLTAWAFLLPAVLAYVIFSWYPIVRGLVVSVQRYHPVNPPEFIGLANFQTLLSDPLFPTAWRNTLYFVFLGIIIGYLVPVTLGILINEIRHRQAYLRVAYYIPSITPAVVTAVLWMWIYDPGVGLLNEVLQQLHLAPLAWLQDPRLSMPSLVIMATWAGAGATTVVYLASLQSIAPDLYEAAEIDGAGVWQRLYNITIPQIRPVMLTMLILQVIGTTQVFTEPYIMTGGGPNNATLTVMLLLYRYAFTYYDFGVAAALGLTIFVVLVIASLLYFRVTNRWSDVS